MGAFVAGLDAGVQRGSQGRQHKQLLSDEEFQTNLTEAQNTIGGLQKKLSTIDPGKNPIDHAIAQQDLAKAIQARTALFHPAVHPNSIQRLGEAIGQHLHAIHPELPAAVQGPQVTSGEMRARATAQLMANALPESPAQQQEEQTAAGIQAKNQQNDAVLAWAQKNGIAGVPLDELKQHLAGVPTTKPTLKPDGKPYKGTDGKFYQPVFDPTTGTVQQQPLPADYAPPPTDRPQTANQMEWGSYAAALGTTVDKLTDKQRGNFDHWKAMQRAVGHNSTSQRIEFDAEGNPHIVTVHASSSPVGAGGGGGGASADRGGSAAATPGSLKKRARAGSSKSAASGNSSAPANNQWNWHRATSQSSAVFKARDVAESSYLDVQKASQDPTPVGDKGIVLSWLRGRVNRVTAQEIATVNNLGNAKVKWDGKVAQITQGLMSKEQRDWFLQSAKNNYDNAQTVAAKYESGAPPASPASQASGSAAGAKPNDPLGVF